MKFHLQSGNKEPIYHQIVVQAEHALHEGSLKAGEQIPSMNELAAQLDISRETVKKAYGILVDKGAIVPKQGKGFYAADVESPSARSQVLLFLTSSPFISKSCTMPWQSGWGMPLRLPS